LAESSATAKDRGRPAGRVRHVKERLRDMRRLRRLQIEPQKTPTKIALDHFVELSDRVNRENAAYREACELDARGEHASADRVLLDAGVPKGRVQDRRRFVLASRS
jgi:hypothetical protein